MEGRRIEDLEKRIGELEGLADAMGSVPDGELVSILERAIGLLSEVNAGLEAELEVSGEGAREVGDLLERIDFGAFDAALEDLEERDPGERGE